MTTAGAEAASAGERKFAVLMFADLSGYTALCERLDPEDVVALIHPVMGALHQVAEQAGGVICTTAGDGFFTVFGVPRASEDPAMQALRAAQMIRSLVKTTRADPRQVDFPGVHIGIAAGEVLVVPASSAPGFNVVGSPVNLASRLCDAAATHEVVVDAACRTLTASSVPWQDQRHLQLRGLEQPIATWKLPDDVDLSPPPAKARFVDRTGILSGLDAALSRVREQQTGQVLAVCGDAGMGKSRVLEHWLEERADTASLWFQCGQQSAAGELLELLQQLATMSGQHLPAFLNTAFDRSSGRNIPDPSSYVDPFPAVVVAARRLLESVSTRGLVLVLDDLHQADPSLVALADDLRDKPLSARLLVVGTWRTGEFDPGRSMDMQVQPLADEHVDELLTSVIGGAVDETVRGALLTRLAGHPLMTEQSASYLLESGAISVDNGVVSAASPDAIVALPTSLRLFVSARIDRLPADEKSLLMTMSVLGPEFASTDLLTLGAHTAQALPGLVERGLVIRIGDDRLRFGHGVVQEIAYASLPRTQRGQLHRRVLHGLGAAADETRRAHHAVAWAESTSQGDPAQRQEAVAAALTESLKCGRRLMGAQTMSALAVLTRALDVVETDASTNGPLVQVLTTAANCLIEMWRFPEAEQLAARALRLCDPTDPSSPALDARLSLGAARSRRRHFQSARQVLDEALLLAESSGDEMAKGRALRLLGETWRFTSYAKFLQHVEQSFAVLDNAGDIEGAADNARLLAYLTSLSPSPHYQRWLALAVERTAPDDDRGQAMLARTSAMAALYRLDLESARASAAAAMELADSVGALDTVGDALLVLIDVAVASGSSHDFERYLAAYSELAERTGNQRTRLFVSTSSALGLLRSGQVAAALEAIAVAGRDCDDFGAVERAEVAAVTAQFHRDRGEWPRALDDLALAMASSSEGPMDIETLLYRCQDARVRVSSGSGMHQRTATALVRDCDDANAPFLASYARAVAEQASVLAREDVTPARPIEGACLEEQGIRADTAALLAERDGADATKAWTRAAETWERLGVTIWLARAQHRSGDSVAATKTLDLLDASDEARAWVGQR